MATIETNLMTYLSAQLASVQFYASRIPQKDAIFPNVVYHLISTTPIKKLGGETGLVQCRVQLDCWGYQYGDVATLAESLRTKLDGYQGTMGTMTNVLAWRDNQFAAPAEWNGDGSDTVHHRIITDYLIFYYETVPTFA